MLYNKKKMTWIIPRVTVLVACWLSVGDVHAQDPQQQPNRFELRVGYGYSDNVFRDDMIGLDSEFAIVGLAVDWNLVRPRYELNLLGDIDYYTYPESQVRDRPDGDLDARLTVQLLPDRISWYVANTYSQIRQDVTLGDTPDNLSEINILASGVTGSLPIGNRTIIQADAGGSDRRVDSLNQLDSKELTAGLGLFRQIRPRSRLGLAASISNIVYDDLFNTEFDIESILIRYQSQLGSGDVSVDLGATRLSNKLLPSGGGTEPLFRIDWTRSVGTRSQLVISARHRISELGGSISSAPPGQIGTPPSVATPIPFRDTSLGVSLDIMRDRASLTGGIFLGQQVFDSILVEDANTIGLNMSLLRDLSNSVSVSLSGVFGRRELIRTEEKSDDFSVRLTIRKILSRRFSISGIYIFNSRYSQIGQDFSENVYRLDLAVLVTR